MEDFIRKITKEAGDELLNRFKKDKELLSLRQGSKEVVTKHDKEIDKIIIKELEKKYPSHGILTEESGFNNKKSNYLWIIDSLDGSGNFANGNPLFSVCIALMDKEKIILAATYIPVIQEFYFAKKDNGAFLNDKKINVSSVNKLSGSYLFFCDGHEKDKQKLSLKLSSVFENVIDLRKIGSAGVETGWVASGRADGFLIFQGDPWDIASGVLIIEEAGGKVTDFESNLWSNKRDDFIFSNKKIHFEIQKLLQ